MKFYAPGDQPIHLSLTSGHTANVATRAEGGTELSTRFHREAISNGCLPMHMAVEDTQDEPTGGIDRVETIKDAMKTIIESPTDETTTGDGKPDTRALSKLVGFTVTADERNQLFNELVAELGEDE